MKLAEQLGYEFVDINSKGARRYTHTGAPDALILPAMCEHAARTLERRMLAATGNLVQKPKRDPKAVRDRQSRDRELQRLEKARHQAALADLIAERNRMLSGYAADLTRGQVVAIEQSIERAERQVAYYERLMTESPSSADHSGKSRSARHRAGAA